MKKNTWEKDDKFCRKIILGLFPTFCNVYFLLNQLALVNIFCGTHTAPRSINLKY